jgi:hypothetical protein
VLCGVFDVRGMQGYLKMWIYRLWTCIEMCLICYMFGSRHIARVVLCLLSFYIHVLLFPLIRGTFVYFLCTRVVPLCAFYLILLLIKYTHQNLNILDIKFTSLECQKAAHFDIECPCKRGKSALDLLY